MTPPPARTRMLRRRAPRSGGSTPGSVDTAAVSGRPRLLARVTAVLLAAGLVLAPQAATAATPTPTPTGPSGTVSATLAPGSDGLLRPDRGLTATIAIDNDTASDLPAGRASLQLGATPLVDRAALAAWLQSGTGDFPLAEVGAAQLDAVAADTSRAAAVSVTADNLALAGLAPGVYPLLTSYSTPSGAVTATSVVTVPAVSTDAVPVGIVVPITADPATRGLLTARDLSTLTADDGSLTAQLDAVAGTSAILAIDPSIAASIRALGTSAPSTAVAWLERLDDLPNSRFALQFGDADIASQLAAGQPAPAQPTSLTAYMKSADFSSPSSDGASAPSPAPTGSEPTLPSLDELTDVGATVPVYWPATGTAGGDTVSVLSALGTPDAAATTLVASTSTTAGQNGAAVAAAARTGDAPVLVYDAAVSSALRDASRVSDDALRGAPLAAAGAYLFLALGSTDGRPLLVTVDRGSSRDGEGLADAITAVETAPGTTSASLPQLLSAPASDVEVTAGTVDPERVAAASALFSDEASLQPLASVVSDPQLLTGPARAELLQVLGGGWLDQKAAWDAAVTAHRKATADTISSVEILQPTPVSLASSGAPLGVWIRNDLPYPIDVDLVVTPDDPRLTVQRTTSVTVPASSNMRAKVPVESRVGSGEVTLTMELRSATGDVVGPARSVDVTVRAEWEGVGIAALSVVVGALIVFGLVRTILRRRRARSAE
ncbi:DUF6049 family protein [Microbacterium sp. 1P10UB]|uniref:DUF6049 family protein n=1 Tax=unclassified Microbacterium TaxID=2609290 RepID=UPI00399FC098